MITLLSCLCKQQLCRNVCKVNNNCNNSNNHVTKKFRCFKNFKVDDFVNDLKESNWTVDDTQLTSFVSKFTMICDKHVTIKTIRFKDKMCPWLENRDDIILIKCMTKIIIIIKQSKVMLVMSSGISIRRSGIKLMC